MEVGAVLLNYSYDRIVSDLLQLRIVIILFDKSFEISPIRMWAYESEYQPLNQRKHQLSKGAPILELASGLKFRKYFNCQNSKQARRVHQIWQLLLNTLNE